MSRVLIPLADGFEDIEAVTVVDVLRRGGVDVVTAAIGSSVDVRSAHGMSMKADVTLASAADGAYDAIVLPGGGGGTANLKKSDILAKCLKRQRDEGRLLCAICAAPTVLTDLGLIDPERHITCYPSCALEIDRPCADAPVVMDGNVITGQAPGSALLFSLVILQTLVGEVAARKVARGLVTDVF